MTDGWSTVHLTASVPVYGVPRPGYRPGKITILWACLQREIAQAVGTTMGFGFILRVLEPVFHIGVIVLWHWLMRIHPVYGTSKVLFIGSGLYPLYVFIHTSLLFGNLRKTDSANQRFPNVTILDIVFARVLMTMITYCMIGIVFFGIVYWFITSQALPFEPLKVISAVTLLLLLGVGVGMCNAVIDYYFPFWHTIYSPLARSMVLFAGILYVPDFLPISIRGVLIWNPALHAVALFRQGFYPGYPTVVYDQNYLLACTACALALGFCLITVFKREVNNQ